jgi:hypothetical protein
MLRRVVDKYGKNWDMLLPHLIFALLEVPQAPTGFSPLRLVVRATLQRHFEFSKRSLAEPTVSLPLIH